MVGVSVAVSVAVGVGGSGGQPFRALFTETMISSTVTLSSPLKSPSQIAPTRKGALAHKMPSRSKKSTVSRFMTDLLRGVVPVCTASDGAHRKFRAERRRVTERSSRLGGFVESSVI
jgi:hypothetical protein